MTTSDVWSDPGTTSWSFDDNGSVVSGGTGATVSHLDNNPGPETATATQTDAAGNVATDSATITISRCRPAEHRAADDHERVCPGRRRHAGLQPRQLDG